MKKPPFYNFFEAEDICRCKGLRCKKKTDCLRYMAKREEVCSNAGFGGKNCEYFMPMAVWRTAKGKELMLSQITDQHLLAIIIHLYERQSVFRTDTYSKDLILNFTKEAVRRGLMESVLEGL